MTDVDTMLALMREFGVVSSRGPGRVLVLDASGAQCTGPVRHGGAACASISSCAAAGLAGRRACRCRGCAIGARPIDLHLKALEALSADVNIESGYIQARTKGDRLRGGRCGCPSPSVGATETALMAAVLANKTEILNAARDPEVCDLALCLVAMGARIEGAGTHRILLQGVDALQHARHDLITDRIEAGTYAIAAAITGGHLEILGAHRASRSVGAALESAGVQIWPTDRGLMVVRSGPLQAIDITTEPYLDFRPTCRRSSWL